MIDSAKVQGGKLFQDFRDTIGTIQDDWKSAGDRTDQERRGSVTTKATTGSPARGSISATVQDIKDFWTDVVGGENQIKPPMAGKFDLTIKPVRDRR